MRVTFNSSFLQAEADLSRAAERLADTQRQVSSGRRVQAASDDPSAAAAGVVERSKIATYDQYADAADAASARLAVVDTVLADVLERLTGAQTAILSARGSAVTTTQREAAANELAGIRDALLSDFNTTFRGTYLFSGSAATTAPFRKDPDGTIAANAIDQTPVLLEIDQSTTVQITYSAEAIARGTASDDIFTHLERAIAAVRSANDADMQSATDALEAAFARATAAQSHAGSSMRMIDTQQGRVDALRRASEARIAGLENANMAKAISEMSQADTAYRAALGAVSTQSRNSLMDYLR
jgi:flagellar hook-associated protein 3 FlgL